MEDQALHLNIGSTPENHLLGPHGAEASKGAQTARIQASQWCGPYPLPELQH